MNRENEILGAIESIRQGREALEESPVTAAILIACGWGILRFFGVPIPVAPAIVNHRDKDFRSLPDHVWSQAANEMAHHAITMFNESFDGLVENNDFRGDFRSFVVGLQELWMRGLTDNKVTLHALMVFEMNTPEVGEQFQVPKLGLA